ncbi:MAG: LCP family protein [Clostridium sp.]|nr:LCP family protein [Clostridium sp.]
MLLCGIWTARNLIKKYNMIQRPTDFDIGKESNENLSAKKIESMKGYWTIALFGVDSRDDAVGRGNNADVIIICNINQDNGEIKLVSVFRDSYLNVDENGTYNKINQAYFTGGPKQAIKALNRNLDLQIDDFATFNWKAVADAVNILGGVDVELSKAEFHYINAFITETVEATGIASLHLKKAGMNHLDGVQAVAYARLRKMDTDFARTERQRKIIDLSFQKLKQADFAVVNNVMEVVFPQILSSITLDDVIPAAKNLTKFTIADTAGFPWARSDANMGKKGDCVIPQTLESNVIRLHQFLYGEEDYEPSDMVKQISAKISADTGMYNEGKVIDKVGTDGGYIPKPTEAPKATESPERTTGEDETESSASETDESIIDGEYDWDLELETDEYGNPIDPPEDWDYGYPGGRPNSGTGPDESGSGSRPSSGAVTPGGTTSPTDSSRYPGGTVSPTDSSRYPGGTVSPTDSSRYPGSTTSASDEVTGPGINPTRPTSPTAAYPGGTTRSTEADGPGSVIIGPGQ